MSRKSIQNMYIGKYQQRKNKNWLYLREEGKENSNDENQKDTIKEKV